MVLVVVLVVDGDGQLFDGEGMTRAVGWFGEADGFGDDDDSNGITNCFQSSVVDFGDSTGFDDC